MFQLYYECECARHLFPPSTTARSELSSIDFVPTLPSSSLLTSSSTSTLAESSITSTTTLTSSTSTTSETESTPIIPKIVAEKIDSPVNEDYDDYEVDDESKRTNDPVKSETTRDDSSKFDESEATSQRRKRSATVDEDTEMWGKLIPGACMKGCAMGFWSFSIVSMLINCLGCSARIGNLLINYRCVSKQDKSVTQGLILMLISLFALIPGPILVKYLKPI